MSSSVPLSRSAERDRCNLKTETVSRTLATSVWRALCLALLAICTQIALAATGDSAAPMSGNKLLIVTAEASRVQARGLAALLGDHFAFQVSILSTDEYAPGTDERAHDGFIYLGSHYPTAPKPGFLQDIANTKKPVLWIGYHGWLLDDAFLRHKEMRIQDRHSTVYDSVVLRSVEPLPPTDTTWIEAPERAVLYWLYDAARLRTLPGAVRFGNFTYVSYFPSFDATKPDFGAFLAALRATFGGGPPPPGPLPRYEERLGAARADRFRTGIHLPIYVATTTNTAVGYDSERLHARLARIREAGAEWVTLSQIYYQDGLRAADIRAAPELTPSFVSLRNVVRDAHAVGLMVRLSVVVNLAEGTAGPNDWRGMIRPAQADAWWRSFRDLVLRAAEFARDNEVESLNVGAELNAMQVDAPRWRELVWAVKEEAGFRGLVGYQVNFDALDSMAWADELDYIAIAAYWPLAANRDPSLAELSRSWAKIGGILANWLRRHPQVGIEFGEIGYASQPYASVLPYSWKPDRGRAQSLQEQLKCYQSLERFLAGQRLVAGVHFFASTAEDFDPKSIGYTPFGKPAGEVMTRILRSR